jgi:hypothetical protein
VIRPGYYYYYFFFFATKPMMTDRSIINNKIICEFLSYTGYLYVLNYVLTGPAVLLMDRPMFMVRVFGV